VNAVGKASAFGGRTCSFRVLLFACFGFVAPLLGIVMFILQNMPGFAPGYLSASLFGMDLAKRKAVMPETGMQNSGLGACDLVCAQRK
jgi:predicted Na+-dependent transporter